MNQQTASTASDSAPLTDADIDALVDLLCADWTPTQTMDLEEIDGLLAGLICAPVPQTIADAIEPIFGDEQPEWPDVDTARRFTDLLQRRWNEVALALSAPIERLDDERAYVPLLTEWDEADEGLQKALAAGEFDRLPLYGELWALGFMHAVALAQREWDKLPDGDEEGAQLVDEALSDIEALIPDEDEPTPAQSVEERDEMVADAIFAAYDLHEYVRRVTFERNRPKEPVRRAPKVGRNDPCPCGSGKKYKACCGREQ